LKINGLGLFFLQKSRGEFLYSCKKADSYFEIYKILKDVCCRLR